MQENQYFKIYQLLTSKEAVFIRVVAIVLLFLVFLLFIENYDIILRLFLFGFLVFVQELFVYRLSKRNPEVTLENAGSLINCLSFKLRNEILSNNSCFEIANHIASSYEGRFFIDRINPELRLTNVQIEKDVLLNQASELVSAMNGKYIFPVDILASYILLQEESAKLLEQESLRKNDILQILYWTRKRFRIGFSRSKSSTFSGSGVFDSLVFGWTPETHNYTSDFTNEVLRLGYEPKAIGRDVEYRQLIESLSRDNSSNVLLTGETGVGKTTLAMNFAYSAYKGLLTKKLKNKRVYFLYIDRLLSGVDNIGEIESRLGNIFTEISHSGNIIVYIENIENIFGGGGFNTDISGAIQPYLESSKIHIIGTTTPQAYKDFIFKKPGIQSLFVDIRLDPPDANKALYMLIEEIDTREKLSKVIVTFSALKEIILSAMLYSPELSLPGSGANLLEDVMVRNFNRGKNVVRSVDVKELISEKTGVNLSTPTQEEKKTLLNMEEIMHKKLIGQDEAVSAISNALRRMRSGLKKTQGPVASFLFLGPTGVGKTTAAKILAKEYYGSEERFIRVDMSEYQTQDTVKKLLGEMPGEQSFNDSLIDKVHDNPFSLVLLDEFEKAHPKLLDIFLQVFDEGFLTNNLGKKISFANTIIIATSNAGSEFIREKMEVGIRSQEKELVEYVLTKGIFRPELINRFDDIVVFHPLEQDQVLKISELRLTDLKEKLLKQSINISFTDQAIVKVSKESFDADFGARNVRRYIEDNIENLISRLILEEKIKKGDNILINVDEGNNFKVEK